MSEETVPEENPPVEDEGAERGGADGKAKALGIPGLGDYGRPSRRGNAEEVNAESAKATGE
jgi:hypothetical protein